MNRHILHADMDAFFASVEQVLHPEYRSQPLIVGGPEARGVVSAASYEARRFGVHSAMPIWKARQLCPQGIFLPVNGPACAEASQRALEIYQSYTPRLDPISIDEACLDISGSLKLFGPPEQIARAIQDRIERELGLSVSIGLAPNRLVAKMASDWHKPRGLTIVTPEQLPDILAPLPAEKLWGLGPVTAQRLKQMGISTIGQIQRLPVLLLEREFGAHGRQLHRAALGQDDTPVPIYDGTREWRQMSEETTLARDTRDVELLGRTLLVLCDELARRLRREGYQARTVTLKIRLEDFTNFTRSCTMDRVTDSELDLYAEATRLLGQVVGCKAGACTPPDRGGVQAPALQSAYKLGARRVRLIGVAAGNLVRTGMPWQLSLFEESASRRRSLCRARDRIIGQFGKRAIERASLMDD
ncbi:DNA polymerase IV [bacterium]|nr:DNA polymerase IV [bacterium]